MHVSICTQILPPASSALPHPCRSPQSSRAARPQDSLRRSPPISLWLEAVHGPASARRSFVSPSPDLAFWSCFCLSQPPSPSTRFLDSTLAWSSAVGGAGQAVVVPAFKLCPSLPFPPALHPEDHPRDSVISLSTSSLRLFAIAISSSLLLPHSSSIDPAQTSK